MMQMLERKIFPCPTLEQAELESVYPLPTKAQIFIVSILYVEDGESTLFFGRVRENTKGEPYMEILFYDPEIYPEEGYRRFIIQSGYAMSEEDEQEFLDMTRRSVFQTVRENYTEFQEDVQLYFPEIKCRIYGELEIGPYLEHLYYASHKSGPKEILYKAGMERIAYALEDVEDYNLIGTSPETILGGMPLRLIRILESIRLYDRIFIAQDREKSIEVYRRFSNYFQGNRYPTLPQWLYLEDYESNPLFRTFDIHMYRRLGKGRSEMDYVWCKRYVELANCLGPQNPYPQFPKIRHLREIVLKMQTMAYYLDETMANDRKLSRTSRERYVFEDDMYLLITPVKTIQFVEEALSQDNCVMEYIESVASGVTNIVFLRKKDNPTKPYVTIEIHDREIIQARAKFNTNPKKRDWEFIEKMAYHFCLRYDPYKLIAGYGPDDDPEYWDKETSQYLEEFERRNGWPIYPESGVDGEQISLQDYFPQFFIDIAS